MEYRFNLSF